MGPFVVKSTLLVLFFVGAGLGRSVISQKKDQATIDKEVLLEDDEYDDDVLDLSPEEQKIRLQSLVEKKIDVNKDGYVDLEELKAWSLKAYNKFEMDDIKDEYAVVDTDQDGAVSWSEHSKETFGMEYKEKDPRLANPETDGDKANAMLYKKDRRLFTVADADMDQRLNINEYMGLKHPRTNEITKKVLIDDRLEALDEDKDGALSLDEFLKGEKEQEGDEGYLESEKERFREELDKNQDGVLSDEEIVEWLDPNNVEEAYEEANHLLEECDSDGDSKLSVSEIVNNHEIWVESDATDYGRHLLLNHDEF